MAEQEVRFYLSPTQEDYVNSSAVINVIISNTGEGKTWASIAAIIRHMQRCGKSIRCAIVRDTHENIKNSTARSIQDFFEFYPAGYKFKNDFKQLTIFAKPHRIEVDLFGIDDLGSLSKLQGPEYALIWLEEPAPMAEKVNAGLSEEVYNAALVRCARQKGTQARLQISMNPADEDHWTHARLIEIPDGPDPDYPLITKRVWFVPYGENQFVSELSRQAVKAAYKDDPASYARYVEGKFAAVYRGVAVTPQYNRERHLSKVFLAPAPGLVSFAFFDSWSNPSCVLGQITQYNRLIYLDVLRLEGSDIKTLLELKVIPLLESPRWKGKSKAWRVGGDCTMKNMDQSNKLVSAAKRVTKVFPGTFFEAGPPQWDDIRQHLPTVLRASDFRGEPMILLSADNPVIDNGCRILDKGLAGAWHYPTNNAGEKTRSTPMKDEASHPCDAWANSVCVLLPSKISRTSKKRNRAHAARTRRRVRSYATAGGYGG